MKVTVIAEVVYNFTENKYYEKKFLFVVDKETNKTYQCWKQDITFRKSNEHELILLDKSIAYMWVSQQVEQEDLKENEPLIRQKLMSELRADLRTELIDRIKEVMADTFEDDMDKVTDMLQMIVDNQDITKGLKKFKDFYSYLSMAEIRATFNVIKLNPIDMLADLFRQAENIHIENLNERPTGWNVTGSQAKETINAFAEFNFGKDSSMYQEFVDVLDSMGC